MKQSGTRRNERSWMVRMEGVPAKGGRTKSGEWKRAKGPVKASAGRGIRSLCQKMYIMRSEKGRRRYRKLAGRG